MVKELADEYEGQNVLFLDQDVDASLGERLDRWFLGYGSSVSVYLPVVMVDSGNRVSNGSEDFHAVYSLMVDISLQRPATVSMVVESERVGDDLHFNVRLTNSSGTSLGAANSATLTALVYEESMTTDVPVVAAAGTTPITTLADGATGEFTFEVAVGSANWDLVRWVVIADYQPIGADYPFDTLQAAMGP